MKGLVPGNDSLVSINHTLPFWTPTHKIKRPWPVSHPKGNSKYARTLIDVKKLFIPHRRSWFSELQTCLLEDSLLESVELLATLGQQWLVDVWDHTSSGNGSLDQWVQLLVSSDGQLQVSWSNSLDLEILGSVASKFEDLGCEVLEDGCRVNSSSGSNSLGCAHSLFE